VSQVVRVDSFKELERELRKDLRKKRRRVAGAVRKTARMGATYVRRNLPVAFGELRNSIEAKDATARAKGAAAKIVADAPHAAPVETGSRPHWPPLAPLIAWVKLRGMQGLTGRKGKGPSKRLPGTTTRGHAQSIAGQLRGMESGGSLDVNAPERVARAIQAGIAKKGTKPHWYMRNAVPEVRKILHQNMEKAIHGDGGEEAGD
jgi:hypothetical protein